MKLTPQVVLVVVAAAQGCGFSQDQKPAPSGSTVTSENNGAGGSSGGGSNASAGTPNRPQDGHPTGSGGPPPPTCEANNTTVLAEPGHAVQTGLEVTLRISSPAPSVRYHWRQPAESAGNAILNPDGNSARWKANTQGTHQVLLDMEHPGVCRHTQVITLDALPVQGCALEGTTLVGLTNCCPNQMVLVDPCTGARTVLSDVGGSEDGFPQGIQAFDSLNRRLLLQRHNEAEDSWHLTTYQMPSGAVVYDALVDRPLYIMEYDPLLEMLVGVRHDEGEWNVVRVDPVTGLRTMLAQIPEQALGPQGTYTLDTESHRLLFPRTAENSLPEVVAVDLVTGAITRQTQGLLALVTHWEYSPVDHAVYGLRCGGTTGTLVRLDPPTGAVVDVARVPVGGSLMGVETMDTQHQRLMVIAQNDIGDNVVRVLDVTTGNVVHDIPANGLFFVEVVPAGPPL